MHKYREFKYLVQALIHFFSNKISFQSFPYNIDFSCELEIIWQNLALAK